jgi:hypothetical protein
MVRWCAPWAADLGEETPFPKLFIVGAPRSGTTWINTIFAHHRLVLTTATESRLYPEVMARLRKHGAHRAQAWDEILESYLSQRQQVLGIHRYVGERTFRQILKEARCRVVECPAWSDDDAANYVIRQVIDRFFYEHGGSEKHLFVEETPLHVMYGREILRAYPEAKILHVLRDGRDVCASLQARSQEADWAPRQRLHQIRIWKQSVEAGMDLLDEREFQDRTALVRYEDVKCNPVAEITRLFDFAGLPAWPHEVQQIAEETEFNRHREKDPGKHNNRDVVGGWRECFSDEDQRLFAKYAGDLFLHCGYQFEDRAHAA